MPIIDNCWQKKKKKKKETNTHLILGRFRESDRRQKLDLPQVVFLCVERVTDERRWLNSYENGLAKNCYAYANTINKVQIPRPSQGKTKFKYFLEKGIKKTQKIKKKKKNK